MTHHPYARLAAARALREQQVAGFLAALAEGRTPSPEQRRAFDAAAHAEHMRRRSLTRDGLLGPLAQAEQLVADAYTREEKPR